LAKFTKRQRREVEMRVLMEQALATGEDWKYIIIARNLGDTPVTPYQHYTPEMFEYLRKQRRILRNAIVHGGKSRHLDASLSEGHLLRVLSDVVTLHDKRLRHPIWAEYLLYFVLPKPDREAIPGDLIEEFRSKVVPKFGPRAARIWFIKQVFASIWPVVKLRVLRALGILSITKYLWQ
jgi:hypothetical protein